MVHEGTHAIDFIDGIDERIISSWSDEKGAYSAEQDFQISKGQESQFPTEEDMMVHIWSNYRK